MDPYVDWMQHDLGFVPLDQQSPSWINNIQVQANVLCGDYASLDKLAKVLDPSKTAMFRNNGYRNFLVDMDYPDYRLSDPAKMGEVCEESCAFMSEFRVNTTGIDSDAFPELADRFRPGFRSNGPRCQRQGAILGIFPAGKSIAPRLISRGEITWCNN